MRRATCLASILFGGWIAVAASPAVPAADFIRGDTDRSGTLEITDPVAALGYLFLGQSGPERCFDASDADDSGAIEITDPIYVLSYLFLGGPQPQPPFPGCGADPTAADDLGCESAPACDTADEVRSALQRELSPDVPDDDYQALVAGNTAFALDLYARVRGEPGNVFFSPLSISMALAMTYAGARGDTEAQMASALRFGLPQERLHPAFNRLDLELATRGQGAAGHEGGGFQLRLVNATWGQRGYGFLDGYLDTLAESYDAGLRLVDFLHDLEPSRVAINDWVEEQTEDRIQDLLPPGSVTGDTRLVLTNAIYFSAAWAEPFPIERTEDGEFRLLDGSVATVPLMSHRWGFAVASGDGWTAAEIPYDGGELSMVLIAPDEGRFAEVEASLGPDLLGLVLSSLAPGDILLTLPRFGCEWDAPLKGPLSELGMVDAFQPFEADLSGMDGARDLFISSVLHKSFIALDEYGTEAAAATAVIVGVVSVPIEVRIDRPFIYLIRDIPTGTILFLGRMVDPRP